MDISMIRSKAAEWVKKYRYIAIVLLVGIVLMLLPTGISKSDAPVEDAPEPQTTPLEVTSDQLESLISQIKGTGKVKVLLSYAGGERKVFHADERSSSTDNSLNQEYETVLIADNNRGEEALVTQILAPEYLGAVVVCQGAEDPSVKLAVSEAVSKATGLGTNKISVLAMK